MTCSQSFWVFSFARCASFTDRTQSPSSSSFISHFSFSSFIFHSHFSFSRAVCAGCCASVQCSGAERLCVETGASEPVGVLCNPDGKIDFTSLGLRLGLEPTKIELNGLTIPKSGLDSTESWAIIQRFFQQNNLNDGTRENPVLVAAFALPTGEEKGSTSEPVSTVVEDIQNIHSKLDRMSASLHDLQESLSRTRAASTINVDDLRVLRSCLDTAPLPEEEEVSLSSLLGAETAGGESFWDEDTYELQHKDEYIRQFKKMTASRDVVWTDANGTKIRKRFSNLEFPVVAKNDLVASLKRFRSFVSVGAVLGVEI